MAIAAIALAALLCVGLLGGAAAAPNLTVTVVTDGSISLAVNDEVWLASNETAMTVGQTKLTSGDGSLALRTTTATSSSSAMGTYQSTVFTWGQAGSSTPCENKTIMVNEVRVYDKTQTVTFHQTFPCGVASISTRNAVSTDWPSFTETTAHKSFATFNEPFVKAVNYKLNDGLKTCRTTTQSGPVVYYDDQLSTMVVSQLEAMKTAEIFCTGHLSLGIKGSVTSIPKFFEAGWIVSLDQGVAQSMTTWGDLLLENGGGKARPGPWSDPVISHIGWWTDNGGYYHYSPEGKTEGAYQKAMYAVADEHEKAGLPFKHWQLDSWWYPKNSSLGDYHWVADPWVFPDGIKGLHDYIKKPLVMHNRWYTPDNWYKAQGIGGDWVGSSSHVLPLDMDTFYEYFFTQQGNFGIATYEQDFMYSQYDAIDALQQNATLADDWLRAMADNAEAHNLTMQYCMPYPREYLVSSRHKNVITIRASGDYSPTEENWRIGRQSLFAYAIGLLPFKDTFLTNDRAEQGGASRAVGPEPNPDLVAAVTVLSGSIVGPGDGLGYTNKTRVMQTCNADGLVLKADRPAFSMDACWTGRDPGGELSWTTTTTDGVVTPYVLAANLGKEFSVTCADVGILDAKCGKNFVSYDWNSRELVAGLPTLKPAPNDSDDKVATWGLWRLSPLQQPSGWALVGEPDKYVGTSSARVTSVDGTAPGTLKVRVAGLKQENIQLCATQSDLKMHCHTVVLGSEGVATVTFAASP